MSALRSCYDTWKASSSKKLQNRWACRWRRQNAGSAARPRACPLSSRPMSCSRAILASEESPMPGAEKKEDLGAPARELVELARAELGEMSTRHRVEGFLEVNARRSPRRSQKRLVLNCAAVLAAVALVVIGY